MRYHEPFSLIKRLTRKDKIVWYYRACDEYGKRTTARSTGESLKSKALDYILKLYREDRLIPARVITKDVAETISFSTYVQDWWRWDKCPYIRGKLANSTKGKPKISRRHADDNRRILENHILPYFRAYPLPTITVRMLEDFKFSLLDKGLSTKRVNNILSCLRVMLNEAGRLGDIDKNPFEAVTPFATDETEGGVLTIDEVRILFDPANIQKIWAGHMLYRAINMFAAVSGARQGEILAIRDEDVHEGYVHIKHSWSIKYGLGSTKTRQERDIPVPKKVMETIEPFIGTGGFVFSFNSGKTAATGNLRN